MNHYNFITIVIFYSNSVSWVRPFVATEWPLSLKWRGVDVGLSASHLCFHWLRGSCLCCGSTWLCVKQMWAASAPQTPLLRELLFYSFPVWWTGKRAIQRKKQKQKTKTEDWLQMYILYRVRKCTLWHSAYKKIEKSFSVIIWQKL